MGCGNPEPWRRCNADFECLEKSVLLVTSYCRLAVRTRKSVLRRTRAVGERGRGALRKRGVLDGARKRLQHGRPGCRLTRGNKRGRQGCARAGSAQLLQDSDDTGDFFWWVHLGLAVWLEASLGWGCGCSAWRARVSVPQDPTRWVPLKSSNCSCRRVVQGT